MKRRSHLEKAVGRERVTVANTCHMRLTESTCNINHLIGMTLMPAKREGKKFLNPVPAKVGGLSLIFKIGPRFFLGAAARSPKHSLGPFHTDPRIFATSSRSGLRITWMGHSTSLAESTGYVYSSILFGMSARPQRNGLAPNVSFPRHLHFRICRTSMP